MLPIRDHEPSEKFPIVTVLLIALNAWVFFQELTASNTEAFIEQWALIPVNVNAGNLLSLVPFVTSQFLHAGFVHIMFNMLYLWIFGDNVEARIGHVRFLFFYLIAGVISGLVQLQFLAGSTIPMLGASGAVAGVLGAYLRLFPHHRVDTFWPDPFLVFAGLSTVTVPAWIVLFFWFATQLLNGTASLVADSAVTGGVAWWAHIGGFLFGWFIVGWNRRSFA